MSLASAGCRSFAEAHNMDQHDRFPARPGLHAYVPKTVIRDSRVFVPVLVPPTVVLPLTEPLPVSAPAALMAMLTWAADWRPGKVRDDPLCRLQPYEVSRPRPCHGAHPRSNDAVGYFAHGLPWRDQSGCWRGLGGLCHRRGAGRLGGGCVGADSRRRSGH